MQMTGAESGVSGATYDLEFCGENRRLQLERLKAAYCEVADALERLEPGQATEPIHRVVLIHAERGLGKTRLAMELYRWLSSECDPGDYWPAESELRRYMAVTPPGELWNDRLENISSPPSFLWWGLQVFSSNSTNTVFDGLHSLFPHLVALHPKSSSRVATAIWDALREVGIELTVALLEPLTFFGTFKAGVHGAFKIHRVLKRTPADDNDEQISSVIDSTLEDLKAIFAPSSRTFAKTPLVLFVDDAQYADSDVTMAAFLERLIYLSSEQGWPLLLVITHWTRELTVGATPGESSRVAQVLRHARGQGDEERGRFANQPGGGLKEDHYVEIDLGDPVEDLTPALRNLFPGLGQRVVEEIVGKSGGNPRKLEQIARYMMRKPVWFIDGSIGNDLTEEGREKVLELSDLPIDEVVLERLREMPPSVRRAVSLASIVGPRFVVDLVDRLAEAHFGEAARGGLEESETTIAMCEKSSTARMMILRYSPSGCSLRRRRNTVPAVWLETNWVAGRATRSCTKSSTACSTGCLMSRTLLPLWALPTEPRP